MIQEDSLRGMIDDLLRADLAALDLALDTQRLTVTLNDPARRFFATESELQLSELSRLGPTVACHDGDPKPLGDQIAQVLLEDRDLGIGSLICSGGPTFVYAVRGKSMRLFLLGQDDSTAQSRASAQESQSHRIRNAINAVQMNAELIRMLADRTDAPDIGRAADRIIDECRRALLSS